MKTCFIWLFISVTAICNGQEFNFDNNGLSPKYLVQEIDSLNQLQLFEKSINWIKENYVNPKEVIKTTIENEKIRFTGAKENVLCWKRLGMVSCSDVRYTIEISFKNGKYKFEPISLEYFDPGGEYSRIGWYKISLISGNDYYKKGKIRKIFNQYPSAIESLFNDVNISLKSYLRENHSVTDEKW